MTAPALRIVRAGLFDTLQDLGRIGFQELGMPTAGAMDSVALRLANALVGNPDDTACLEIGVMGPEIRIEADSARIAVVGPVAPVLTDVDGGAARPIEANRSHLLTRGQTVRVGMVDGVPVGY
ncbi:MAG: allophanate hydrolase, partial [Rhodospirillales bacterium]|nr:allophanate hydrolase [Rhodospirillales bacterium]